MKNQYNKTIGYSPLEDVDRDKMRLVISVNKQIIDRYFSGKHGGIILVAGAGQGDEAELIFEEFELATIGVDINITNCVTLNKHAGLSFQKQRLEKLAFADNSFLLTYCYHVLEHVFDHSAVLNELHRVLVPGGVLFIGFPNKHRLFSYISTSQKASVVEKIKWNMIDYVYRIRGRFENKYGAHAGFTEKEFLSESAGIFKTTRSVRNEYMLIKYSRFTWLIHIIIRTGLSEILFPSNYYVCMK